MVLSGFYTRSFLVWLFMTRIPTSNHQNQRQPYASCVLWIRLEHSIIAFTSLLLQKGGQDKYGLLLYLHCSGSPNIIVTIIEQQRSFKTKTDH